MDAGGECVLQSGDRLPSCAQLPGLTPLVSELFEQVGA